MLVLLNKYLNYYIYFLKLYTFRFSFTINNLIFNIFI